MLSHKTNLYILHIFIFFSQRISFENLRIGSCLACVYRVMDARGNFGEHERSVKARSNGHDS